VSQSARLKKTGPQEIGARLGTLSKANRETVEVWIISREVHNYQEFYNNLFYYKLLLLWTLDHVYSTFYNVEITLYNLYDKLL